jgi:hypothetical protein
MKGGTMGRSGRYGFLVLSLLFVLAVLWQTLLAGLGLFRSDEVWNLHMGTGHLVVAIPLLMLLLSLGLRLGRRTYRYSGLLLVGTVLQADVFAAIRGSVPVVAAFHPVLALLLFAGGGLIVQHAWVIARQPVAHGVRGVVECPSSLNEAAC